MYSKKRDNKIILLYIATIALILFLIFRPFNSNNDYRVKAYTVINKIERSYVVKRVIRQKYYLDLNGDEYKCDYDLYDKVEEGHTYNFLFNGKQLLDTVKVEETINE